MKRLLIALIFVFSCSEEFQPSEGELESIYLPGKWILSERTVISGVDIENCSRLGEAFMVFEPNNAVIRSHRLNCEEIEERGTKTFSNLRTIIFSTYVIDVQNWKLSESELSFEYPTNLDDEGEIERVKEVYKKALN